MQAAEKDAADASTKRCHDEGAVSLNANQVLMLHSRLKIIQARVAQANKTALEAEKQRGELHTQIEEIEEQLQPKRARSDADAHADVGDARTMRNHEKRVADIVVRELKRAKPGVWGCIQAREVWSNEEEANM